MTLTEYIQNDLALSALAAEGADESIAQAINADLVPTTGEVTAHSIRQYLVLVGLLIPIEDSDAPACREAARVLEIFPIIDLANPMILGKFTQVLDDLVSETLIPDFTETHKATILSLAITDKPRFGRTVSNQEVATALRG